MFTCLEPRPGPSTFRGGGGGWGGEALLSEFYGKWNLRFVRAGVP